MTRSHRALLVISSPAFSCLSFSHCIIFNTLEIRWSSGIPDLLSHHRLYIPLSATESFLCRFQQDTPLPVRVWAPCLWGTQGPALLLVSSRAWDGPSCCLGVMFHFLSPSSIQGFWDGPGSISANTPHVVSVTASTLWRFRWL